MKFLKKIYIERLIYIDCQSQWTHDKKCYDLSKYIFDFIFEFFFIIIPKKKFENSKKKI